VGPGRGAVGQRHRRRGDAAGADRYGMTVSALGLPGLSALVPAPPPLPRPRPVRPRRPPVAAWPSRPPASAGDRAMPRRGHDGASSWALFRHYRCRGQRTQRARRHEQATPAPAPPAATPARCARCRTTYPGSPTTCWATGPCGRAARVAHRAARVAHRPALAAAPPTRLSLSCRGGRLSQASVPPVGGPVHRGRRLPGLRVVSRPLPPTARHWYQWIAMLGV
jgi:hypothetical protein